MGNTTLRDFFTTPDSPVITRDAYLSGIPALTPGLMGADITSLMPAAGQNSVPEPQRLYDLRDYWTPFRRLWKRPRNVLQGP